jgi:hypothetical protein
VASEKREPRLHHMPVSERAKIFIPFDPLEGFKEALAKKEHEVEAERKAELSEEARDELDRALEKLDCGMFVRVRYYDGTRRCTLEGAVHALDRKKGVLTVGDTTIELHGLISLELI